MRRNTWLAVALAAVASIVPRSAVADAIADHLGGYHLTISLDRLAETAGGRAALAARLIELRRDNHRPFVGVRAEKMLLALTGESGVPAALADDVHSASFAGLARVVALHIDEVTDPSVRRSLAGAVLERAKTDSGYTTYARALLASTDDAVSSAARTALSR